MRSRIFVSAVFVLLLAATSSTAFARPSARIGVGAESMLGFWAPNQFGDPWHGTSFDVETTRLPSLSVIVAANELFDLQGLLGARLALGTGYSLWQDLVLGARGLYRGLPLADNVDLVVFFGGGFELRTVSVSLEDASRDSFLHLETGLRPEWFVRDWISIHTQIGVSIGLLLGQSSISPSYDAGVSLGFHGVPTLLANTGFTIWF